MSEAETPKADTQPQSNGSRRKRFFLIFAIAVVVVALGFGLYWVLYASNYISTDNAYTAAEISQVTPSTGGTVKEVRVVDTQSVKQGDILVVIDDTDAKLTQAQAAADVQRAVAQLASAEADHVRAGIDLKRHEALIASGSVSGDELTRTQNAFAATKASVEAARATLAQARAKAEQAKVDLDRTVVRAPIDGVIAKRTVQVGQRVQSGAALLSVVPIQDVHVDANFKEAELESVRVGQPAELVSDIYGKSVVFHGTVEGFSGGTGSAFALIPAQNATGNWIKVVQRLPVRIRLDPAELKANPLQVGLSMTVTIDLRKREQEKSTR